MEGKYSPLRIKAADGQFKELPSFLSPQFGAVLLYDTRLSPGYCAFLSFCVCLFVYLYVCLYSLYVCLSPYLCVFVCMHLDGVMCIHTSRARPLWAGNWAAGWLTRGWDDGRIFSTMIWLHNCFPTGLHQQTAHCTTLSLYSFIFKLNREISNKPLLSAIWQILMAENVISFIDSCTKFQQQNLNWSFNYLQRSASSTEATIGAEINQLSRYFAKRKVFDGI